jgi:hypothetical protein
MKIDIEAMQMGSIIGVSDSSMDQLLNKTAYRKPDGTMTTRGHAMAFIYQQSHDLPLTEDQLINLGNLFDKEIEIAKKEQKEIDDRKSEMAVLLAKRKATPRQFDDHTVYRD